MDTRVNVFTLSSTLTVKLNAFQSWLNGYRMIEIAAQRGVTVSYVSRIINTVIDEKAGGDHKLRRRYRKQFRAKHLANRCHGKIDDAGRFVARTIVIALALVLLTSQTLAEGQQNCRSAKTGEFVSAAFAKKHPKTTVCEVKTDVVKQKKQG